MSDRAAETARAPEGDALLVSFKPSIRGVRTRREGIPRVLEEHTALTVRASGPARVVLVQGIGHGRTVGGLTVSSPVRVEPGHGSLLSLGGEELPTPWRAFDDPLAAYDDPVFSFDNPIIAYDDPVFSFDNPIIAHEDPEIGLRAIWGTDGTALPRDAYGLVLFSMPDLSALERMQPIQHSAAIVPFRVGA